jgi:fructose 1,6-bisphosphate aldolase/phosphatase
VNVTLSVMRANVGSVGGHLASAPGLVRAVRDRVRRHARGLLLEFVVSHTGDDVAVLMTHRRGVDDPRIHRLAHDAFLAAVREARAGGLWDGRQAPLEAPEDVAALGPPASVAELTVEERPYEPFLLLAADKAGPGAFNGPLYLAFADPLNTPELAMSPGVGAGFRFVVVDVGRGGGGRSIELVAPEELYELAALLRHPDRYVVESVWSRATREPAAVVAAASLHGSAGRAAQDDPVALVRCEHPFPATGEVLGPFERGHLVASANRSSPLQPLLPAPLAPGVSCTDGLPMVTAAAYTVRDGRLTGPVDAFAHPYWDAVRRRVADQAMDLRRQACFGVSAPAGEASELAAVEERLRALDGRFTARPVPAAGAPAADESALEAATR